MCTHVQHVCTGAHRSQKDVPDLRSYRQCESQDVGAGVEPRSSSVASALKH